MNTRRRDAGLIGVSGAIILAILLGSAAGIEADRRGRARPSKPPKPTPTIVLPTPTPTLAPTPTGAPTPTPTATIAAETPTPGPGSWFGGADPWAGRPAFGTYPLAPAGQLWISGDQGGRTISGLTFRNRPAGVNVIVLDNVSNLVLEDLDFDTVPEGIYANGGSNVTIRRLRARNIFGPYTRTGFHSGNLIQWKDAGVRNPDGARSLVGGIVIEDLKLVQPATVPPGYTAYGTEDVISLGGGPVWGGTSWSAPLVLRRFAFDGGAWTSPSGTGLFVGDGDLGAGTQGQYVSIADGILLNPGQVAIGTGEDGPYRFERIAIEGNRGNEGIQLRTARAGFGGMLVDWIGDRAIATNGHPYETLAPNDWNAELALSVTLGP